MFYLNTILPSLQKSLWARVSHNDYNYLMIFIGMDHS